MQQITLNIAGITIKIQSEITGILERFNEFYKYYITSTENVVSFDYTIKIISKKFKLDFYDTKTNFLNDDFIFQGYAYKKDNKKNEAILTIPSLKNAYQYTEEFLLFIFSELCMKKSKLIFHSSTLFDAHLNAYIFFGPSGIGKSTISNKLKKLSTFSDDMVVIEKLDNGFKLHKTPFERNKIAKPPLTVNIKGFYRLFQANKLNKVELSSGKAMNALLANFWFSEYSNEIIETYLFEIQKMLNNIPVYELHQAKETKQDEILTII